MMGGGSRPNHQHWHCV